MARLTIELENHIADKVKNLIGIFGNEDLLFGTFLKCHRKKVSREISHIQKDLDKYERQYNMSSPLFYEKFESGELEDSKDFILWAGIYEMLKESKEKLRQIS